AQELARVRQTIRRLQPDILINLVAGRGLLKSLRDYVFFKSCGIKKIIGTPLRGPELHVRQMADGKYEPESDRLLSRLSSLG
ncbi:hypothetical protein, partial [Salmonella sp. SAL04281]|uniref:hypothetical protein n=1 Tax=Salmonella sp. SAL04281 TaxID=3159859 RepID=UPI00397B5AFC